MRVTNSMLINTVLRDLYLNNERLIRVQDQLASGQIVSNPSEDPLIADQVINLDLSVSRAIQYIRNGAAGSSYLSLADSNLGDINNLAVTARTLAVKMANDTATTGMRGQAAGEIDQILEQAVDLANQRFRGRYIFGGTETLAPPFEITANGVLYRGNMEHIEVQLTDGSLNEINVTGVDTMAAFDARVMGTVDLNPALDIAADGTKLADLNQGQGVNLGSIRITYGGGPVTVVDLTGSESLEDVGDAIQAATGGGIVVATAGGSITLTNTVGVGITVAEVNQNTTANDLGILGTTAVALLTGADLDPVLTMNTKMSSLAVDTINGFIINNGAASDTFTGADITGTVGDLLTRLNNSAVDVFAEINSASTGINIYSRLNGPTMTITENGGNTAADMGIDEVAGVRADNLFTSLIDLRDALATDDRAAVAATISLLDSSIDNLLIARAEVGARVQRFEMIGRRQEDEKFNLTKLMSEANDLDYSRAVMDFQNLRNSMEAALSMAAQSIPLSLADFL